MSRPMIHDRRTAVLGGVLLISAGSWLLWQGYEARGRQRPFVMKLLPV